MRIILHNQQHLIAILDFLPIIGHLLNACQRQHFHEGGGFEALDQGGAGIMDGQKQGERAALARRTVQPDFAPEQIGEFPADRQSEARASILAARAGIRLLKRFKN